LKSSASAVIPEESVIKKPGMIRSSRALLYWQAYQL
jgi:hypothetical protein